MTIPTNEPTFKVSLENLPRNRAAIEKLRAQFRDIEKASDEKHRTQLQNEGETFYR